MAQYTFSTSDNSLISDIEEIKNRSQGLSFSKIVELLLLQAVKERKRQRSKNAKKIHI
jgi:hypothetical protein